MTPSSVNRLFSHIDALEVLRLGVIGLGFLLAFMAYLLLRTEQERDKERPGMLKAAYVFMGFSLFVVGVTLLDSIWRENLRRIPEIVWDYTWQGNNFTCIANGETIGGPLDCRNFSTCGNGEGNRLVCAGKHYRGAIARVSPGSLRRVLPAGFGMEREAR